MVELWNAGKIDELMTHNIIPTNLKHFNHQDWDWRIRREIGHRKIVHPNHPCLLKEIYKKRKGKKVIGIAVFTNDEVNKFTNIFFNSFKNI